MTGAAAYIRKSSAPSKHTRTVSYEVQEESVRDLARRNGDEVSTILSDWGKSGGSTRRPDYQRLLAMIDAGEIRTVYSFSLSRLSRSLLDFADLLERCRVKGVRVRLVQEGEIDWTSATGRAFANMAATFAQFERELAVERNQAAVAERKDRGDHLGQAPYGWTVVGGQLVKRDDERPDLVFEAFRQGGSFAKAAKLLNEWGVPTRRQGTRWIHGTVADIVRQQGPRDLGPALVKRRGASPLAGAMFAGLLRCPCGATLTPRKDAGAPSGVSGYYCSRSSRTPGHGRMHVAERPVLEWAKGEAARFRVPKQVEMLRQRDEQRKDALEGRRRRVVDNFEDGVIGKAERDAKLAAIAEQIDQLGSTTAVVDVPPLDWNGDPMAINGYLRTLWESVELDADLRPVSALWKLPREYVA